MADLDVTVFLRELSRALAKRDEDLARRRTEPAEALLQLDPYASVRKVASRETLHRLVDRKGDPAAPLLAAHVAELVVRRVARDAELHATDARLRPEVLVHATGERLSVSSAVQKLVARAPDGDLVARALAEHADGAHHAARLTLAREGEIEKRFGVTVTRTPWARDLAAAKARAIVLELGPRLVREAPLHDTLARGAGHGVDVGFPKELSPRTLWELLPSAFREGPPLDPPSPPRPLAPASYVRAFAAVGRGWARAARSRSLPLPLAVTPHRLEEHLLGALFASIFRTDPFLGSGLGLARRERERAARQLATVALHDLLRRALATALLPALLDDRPRDAETTWEELARWVMGTPVAPRLVAVLPRVEGDAPTRLAALGLGAALADELRERFDEDFFRNPRAVEELRHRLAASPPLTADPEAVARGLDRLVQDLSERLA